MHPEPGTSTSPFYTWKPAGHAIAVQLQFDVVDRVLLEIMRGFGAVPKRGAEVGGVLLGTAETQDGKTVVKVDDFEAVECDHAAGPSYILSEDDRAAFREVVERWRPSADKRMYAVGYYRGHTRDGLCLSAEDLSILEELFPDPAAIALIVKPYATKASKAGIFFREDGQFQGESTVLEFPFRRKELGGGTSGMERLTSAARFGQERTGEDPRLRYAREAEAAATNVEAEPAAPVTVTEDRVEEPKKKGPRVGWVWIPLSFIFVLLGALLGFQIALSMRPKQPANPWMEAWDMALQVKRTGNELNITWDPLAPAVRNANRGALVIQSRDESRTIDLRGSQLQGGSVVYRGVPERVVFRLEVYPRERMVVSEIAEFKREP